MYLLLQAHLEFQVVTPRTLKDYKGEILILPDVKCISDEEITEFNIPTGIPIIYQLDDSLSPISREFIGDPEAIRKATEAVANQAVRK